MGTSEMVALRDDGSVSVYVRADVAATYDLCPACHGNRARWTSFGSLYINGWQVFHGYEVHCPTCQDRSIVPKPLPSDRLQSGRAK